MIRFTTMARLAAILGLVGGIVLSSPASAQVIYSYSAPPSPTPVVTTYYHSAPLSTGVYSQPQPTVTYYTPAQPASTTVTYYSPAPPPTTVTYYPPSTFPTTVTYYSPAPQPTTVTYYPSSPPPATTVYSLPATVYIPTTFVSPGTVTTRTYVGLGIFRPFGVNRDTYVTPESRTTYYTPLVP